jgi:hypothetical protein
MLLRSRYFFFALLVHAVFFLVVGTIVVFEAVPLLTDSGTFVPGDEGDGAPPAPAMPEAPPEAQVDPSQSVPVPTAQASATQASALDIIGTAIAAEGAPSIPMPDVVLPTGSLTLSSGSMQSLQDFKGSTSAGFESRAAAVHGMVKAWGRKPGAPGGRNTTAVFKCYIAKYADGDWATTLTLDPKDRSRILKGSLINFLIQMDEYTKGKIKADLVPVPLDLKSDEIFTIKPPFIYFTGHKDFTLRPEEVENLRTYLVQGGCLWGDNGLAGKGSRFDEAFRREMKRVLPDDDKPWEVLPNDHPIFTQGWFPMQGVPEGMNYYKEPIEVIRMDGEISVIYTLNNYSDMYRMVFKAGTNTPETSRSKKVPRSTPREFWDERKTFYRNFEAEPCQRCFEFGINIVVHLLTRFDQKLLLSSPG